MYPPPGSFRYVLPKPTRKELFSSVKEELFTNGTGQCCNWCKNSPMLKCRFWKMIFMIVIVISTGHFSTIIIFPNVHGSLFLIYSKSSRKVPDLFANELPHHRKMNNLMTSNISDLLRSPTLNNFINNINSDIYLDGVNKSVYQLDNQSHSIEKIRTTSLPNFVSVSTYNVPDNFINSNNTEKKQNFQLHPPLIGTREKKIDSRLCPPIPPNLEGPFKVVINNIPPLDVQEKAPNKLSPGGRYRPKECQARHKVAIIIPFRDRAAHLAAFLYNIHPMLQKQQLDYAIFIVEQAGDNKFNRAMLMNIGSLEALKLYPYDCFIFHDIDLIPEDDRNLYTCPEQPRHMSVAINTFKYRLPYNDIFGGVSAMTVEQFKTVNGFSNRFWGWGGEDDDMSNRIKFHGFYISRYPANIARYTMISHKKDRPNPLRYRVLNEGRKRFDNDGLTSVKYKVLDIRLTPLYTWINVDLIKE